MKKYIVILLLLLISTVSYGTTNITTNSYVQLKGYLEAQNVIVDDVWPPVFIIDNSFGVLSLGQWNTPIPFPTDDQLTDVSILALPKELRKVEGVKWVALTADEIATNNLSVYSYENAYLMLCDKTTNTNLHQKLAFEQLPLYLKPLKKGGAAQKQLFEDLRDAFQAVNAALIEKKGIKWWSTCVWHPESVSTNAAQQVYDALMD